MSTSTAPLPSSAAFGSIVVSVWCPWRGSAARFADSQVITLREDGLANEDIYVASREATQLNFGHYETQILHRCRDDPFWSPRAGGTAQVPFLPDARFQVRAFFPGPCRQDRHPRSCMRSEERRVG